MTDYFNYTRRRSDTIELHQHQIGFGAAVDATPEPPRVVTTRNQWAELAPQFASLGDTRPELIYEQLLADSHLVEINPDSPDCSKKISALQKTTPPPLVALSDLSADDAARNTPAALIAAHRHLAEILPENFPVLLKDTRTSPHPDDVKKTDIESALEPTLTAATVLGALLCDGIGDAVLLRSHPTAFAANRLAYNILQASGTRIFKTDYVACPSCGRTLFNLQETTQKIRAATGHLKGVRIAIMGCIVNGPGEMADADFGYVGGAPGKINLYVGKTAVEFNIPEKEAVDRLIDLIKSHDRWVEIV